VIVPAFGMIFYAFSQERQRELEELKSETVRSAGIVAIDEERRIEETRNLLVLLSRSSIVQAPESRDCSDLAADLLRSFPRYRNIGVIDPSGDIVCSALPAASRINVSERDYFRRAMETMDFAGGAFQVGKITRRPGINFAYPVKDGNDRLRGAVFVALDIEEFSRIGREVGSSLPRGATLTKIDASGTVLGRNPREDGLTGKPFTDLALVEPLLSKDGGLATGTGKAGDASVFAVARVPHSVLGKSIFVIVTVPERIAFAEIHRSYSRYLALLGMCIVLALCLVWLGSGYFIQRPLKAILQATDKVAAGDAEARLGPPYEKGELGDLARDFDRMTEAIATRGAEREQAREALLRSEEKYRSIVRNSPLGIYRTTPEGRFLMVNPALVTMLGYDSEEGLLKVDLNTDVFLRPGERRRILEENLPREPGTALVIETEWKRKDGKVLHVRASGTAVRNADGSPAYYEVFVEDETDRRALETQFLHSQRLEAVGRLAGGIAHDFNNLLSVILGYCDILAGRLEGESEIRSKLEEIGKAAQRAAELTRQLLAFSRKQVLDMKVVNLSDVILQARNMFQRLIGEDIELLLNLSPDSGRVRIDPGQLEQVIMNLVINARDAMPRGGKLVIETHQVDFNEPQHRLHGEAIMAAGSYALVAVTDSGCGMEEETLRQIFEPFFTTKEAGKGTGLGLSTVYGIVKQSGGYIWAYSEVGVGTTMKIYLPRIEGKSESAPDRTAAPPGRGSETVLVVEDDASIRDLIRQFLEAYGYRILTAGGSDEALRIAGAHPGPIHLMVTDVIMPGGSGTHLAERLVRTRPEVKILYISGYSDDAISVHGVLKEGTFFLSKPFTRDMLASKVREVLAGT
jgi:PAS domain S-box-containing protein